MIGSIFSALSYDFLNSMRTWELTVFRTTFSAILQDTNSRPPSTQLTPSRLSAEPEVALIGWRLGSEWDSAADTLVHNLFFVNR